MVIENVRQLRGTVDDYCPRGTEGVHTYDYSPGRCRQVKDAAALAVADNADRPSWSGDTGEQHVIEPAAVVPAQNAINGTAAPLGPGMTLSLDGPPANYLANVMRLQTGDVVRLFTFRQGEANLVEMTLPASSPFIGKPCGLIPWPENCTLVTILRDGITYTPDKEQPLEAGDELLFVAAPEAESELATLLNPH